jgi:hypothetical protein
MKKILLAAVVAFSSLAASAQIWVGGSLGANFKTPDFDGAETLKEFTISPEVGYTLNDKWDIAVAINTNLASCDGESATSFAIEPYARYTFANMGNVSFFVDGGFSFGTTETLPTGEAVEDEDAEDEATGGQDSFAIGVRPGIKYAVNEKLSFVAKLGWLGYKNVKDVESNFGFNASGAAISFGAYWNF